ncbi:MAG TPA: pilus assembly protein [Bryobacteraceae bacterium]|nr:pilus assembly protein [Bryobacteraceae bacterium]HOL70155.1 pilus assembly protein [Bryobacteraceae bacterium]HOQ45503.1 pilus assembly protein [Bryobacteraceae bacterium]HPQ17057.1 pilus assembly protein [Bryobacteraceae bacterium]HPU74155.1 pilus assembly protein [Bryobacteraceae bacterium]
MRRRGNVTIEFALSFALLFSVLGGVFQFGYSFYIYNALETVVRDAARYASLRAYNSPSSTPSSEFLTAVRNMAVYGNPAGGSQAVVPGLTPSHIALTVTFDRNVPYRVKVAIQNYTVHAVFFSFVLNGKPYAEFRYMGRYAPTST